MATPRSVKEAEQVEGGLVKEVGEERAREGPISSPSLSPLSYF
jgi:hypothetical protein